MGKRPHERKKGGVSVTKTPMGARATKSLPVDLGAVRIWIGQIQVELQNAKVDEPVSDVV